MSLLSFSFSAVCAIRMQYAAALRGAHPAQSQHLQPTRQYRVFPAIVADAPRTVNLPQCRFHPLGLSRLICTSSSEEDRRAVRAETAGLCPAPRDSFSSLPASGEVNTPPAVSQNATCRISRGTELSRNRCPLWCSLHPANSKFISDPLVGIHNLCFTSLSNQMVQPVWAMHEPAK